MNVMRSLKYVLLVAGLVAAFSPAAQGQFYQYTDKNGNTVFTDTPPPGSDAKEKKTKGSGVFFSAPRREPEHTITRDSGKTQEAPPQERQSRQDFGGITVVMYKTNW